MRVEADITAATDWVAWHERARRDGFSILEFLGARSGEGGSVVVTSCVRRPDSVEVQFAETQVAKEAELPSLAAVFPGARWHEAEAAELVGVAIAGANGGLLLDDDATTPTPLAHQFPLAQRVEEPWPGVYEPGGPKRRLKPTPGVRDGWLTGGER